MRIGRIGETGSEIPVVANSCGKLLDLRGLCADLTPEFLDDGGLELIRERLARASLPAVAIDPTVRIAAPIRRPGKVLCIGLNYADHAEESDMKKPAEPILFAKMSNTVVGPYDEVLIPRGSVKTDYEVELAVIIGKTARYLESPADSHQVIAGYTISNDVSEREFQLERGGQWIKGKSCETFNPLGPWFVTADEIADPQHLALRLWVNGELRQNSSTDHMIFGVYHLVWYLSQFMVLEPGDVVNTGTPAGVALGSETVPYLRAGDVMELEIENLGCQRQTLAQA